MADPVIKEYDERVGRAQSLAREVMDYKTTDQFLVGMDCLDRQYLDLIEGWESSHQPGKQGLVSLLGCVKDLLSTRLDRIRMKEFVERMVAGD